MKTYNLVDLIYDIQTAEIPFNAALIIASTPKKYVIISGNEYTATNHPKQALRRIPVTSTIDQAQAIKIVNAKEYQEYILNPKN